MRKSRSPQGTASLPVGANAAADAAPNDEFSARAAASSSAGGAEAAEARIVRRVDEAMPGPELSSANAQSSDDDVEDLDEDDARTRLRQLLRDDAFGLRNYECNTHPADPFTGRDLGDAHRRLAEVFAPGPWRIDGQRERKSANHDNIVDDVKKSPRARAAPRGFALSCKNMPRAVRRSRNHPNFVSSRPVGRPAGTARRAEILPVFCHVLQGDDGKQSNATKVSSEIGSGAGTASRRRTASRGARGPA